MIRTGIIFFLLCELDHLKGLSFSFSRWRNKYDFMLSLGECVNLKFHAVIWFKIVCSWSNYKWSRFILMFDWASAWHNKAHLHSNVIPLYIVKKIIKMPPHGLHIGKTKEIKSRIIMLKVSHPICSYKIVLLINNFLIII